MPEETYSKVTRKMAGNINVLFIVQKNSICRAITISQDWLLNSQHFLAILKKGKLFKLKKITYTL